MPGRRMLIVPALWFGLASVVLAVGCSAEEQAEPSPTVTTQRSGPVTTAPPPQARAFPAPKDAALPKEVRRRLDRVLEANVEAGASHGAAAAVVTEGGHWAGVAGLAPDGRPLVPGTALMIASITKTFTAAEVVLLASRGLVDLDARASAYVELPVKDNGATVRDLLRMRSGIPEFIDGPQAASARVETRRHWTPAEVLRDVDAEQVSEPGVFYEYSNSNYILLGQIIERVTGQSFAQALHKDLLDGRGLDRVAVQDEDIPRPPVARAPAHLTGGTPFLPNRAAASLAWASGSIAADAASVARWGYLLYGGRVLSQELVTSMLPGEGIRYGLGTRTMADAVSGEAFVGHDGEFEIYRTALSIGLDRPLAIAVLLTRDDEVSEPETVVRALADVLTGE